MVFDPVDYMPSIVQDLLDSTLEIRLEPARARVWQAVLDHCTTILDMIMYAVGDVVSVRTILANECSINVLGAQKMSRDD